MATGQWIGLLLSPNICHRSVTFKYDYPSSSRFTSHHIGYGDSYVKLISDSTCELYGFNQYFDANLVEGFSFKSCKDSAAKKICNAQVCLMVNVLCLILVH